MDTYAITRITNISRREGVHAGFVLADSHEDARRLACERDIILDFQTFRAELIEPQALLDCDSCGEHFSSYDGSDGLSCGVCVPGEAI